jgi:hypothetical protein
MKTKNNVQKTILRSVAVLISFVLISFTVSAQEFWRKLLTNSSFNEIALAMVEISDKTKTAGKATSEFRFDLFINEDYDATLELEKWMTNDYYFGFTGFQVVREQESTLELESWMLNEDYFNRQQEGEQPLALENWMTSAEVWNN